MSPHEADPRAVASGIAPGAAGEARDGPIWVRPTIDVSRNSGCETFMSGDAFPQTES